MDLRALLERLGQLEARYQTWVDPIDQAMQTLTYRVNRNGYSYADYQRDIQHIRQEQLAKYDPYQEMNAFFDELCSAYLTASSDKRAAIRKAASDRAGIPSGLLGYVYRSATRLRASDGAEWLRRGLVAASIENCCRDWRDALLALAELYVAAEEAGIDPRSEFRAASRLSGAEAVPGGNRSMQQILLQFHRYAVLKERRAKDA